MIEYVFFPEGHPFYSASEPVVYENRGKWVVRYRDHHTVKQDMEFDLEANARAQAFKWKLLRSIFTSEVFGGCASEVAAYWDLPIFHTHHVPA